MSGKIGIEAAKALWLGARMNGQSVVSITMTVCQTVMTGVFMPGIGMMVGALVIEAIGLVASRQKGLICLGGHGVSATDRSLLTDCH